MKEERVAYRTCSDRETISLGRRLGAVLRPGDAVALVGELGSGKTWFAKGLARGLGVSPDIVVTSPSFALVNEYDGRCGFHHMDAYRLKELSEFFNAGLDEYFTDKDVVALEWADRWPEALPAHTVWVTIRIVDAETREIVFSGRHVRVSEMLQQFSEKE